jgi:hypothetical protein
MGTSTETGVQEIPMQYHDFKDVFEKKNADTSRKPCYKQHFFLALLYLDAYRTWVGSSVSRVCSCLR